MNAPAPLDVLITGGAGDLACAIIAALPGERIHAPPHAELDVSDEAQVDAYVAKLARIDVLIANAGIARDGLLSGQGMDAVNETLDTNLRGAFLCARAAIRLMVKQRSGHILLIGSRAARHGTPGQAAYAAAKAGLVGLGLSIAQEYGGRNIRCNVVLPGFLETKMTAKMAPERVEAVRGQHALGRFNRLEDSARTIAFLARLDHVSGQVFTLDSRIDKWT